MAEIIYKRLVDVKILNEYYLLNSDEQSFFAITDETERKTFLDNRVLFGQYNLSEDLAIEPIGQTAQTLRSYKIRLVPQSTGFMLGLEVRPETQDGETLEYRPKIPIDQPIRLYFGLQVRNAMLLNFSGLPYRARVPAIYFFSNDDSSFQRQFPVLSLPVAAFQEGRTYEMGEIAKINNELQEAVVRTNSAAPENWRTVVGDGFLNQRDLVLLPNRFVYTFLPEKVVSQAVFKLKKTDGTVVKAIEKNANGAGALSRVNLDFSSQDPAANGGAGTSIPAGFYDLEINGDNDFGETMQIYLNENIYRREYLGVVEIVINPSNTGPFRLLKDNGTLITGIDADGAPIGHPEFEIRIRSRITYWRYISNKKRELAIGTKAIPFLTKTGRVLVSNEPRKLSFSPTIFVQEDPNLGLRETLFLPNPAPTPLQERDGRIYSDIYVPQIKDTIEEII